MSPQTARQRTRTYQIGAAALVLCAGAAVALPLGKLLAPPNPVDHKGNVDLPKHGASNTRIVSEADINAAGPLLANAMGWEKPTTPDMPEHGPETPKPAPEPHAAPGQWVYVGSIMSPSAVRAVIKLGNEQFLLKEGESHQGTTLNEVTPEAITIETNHITKKIPIEKQQLTWTNEAPKRPVVFRQPGVVHPVGVPGTPNTPQSFEQARRQLKHGAQGIPTGPAATSFSMRDRIESVDQSLSEQNLPPARQAALLRELGIDVHAVNAEEAITRLKQSGVNLDQYPSLIRAIQEQANGHHPGANR